jgi:hypothetical protein
VTPGMVIRLLGGVIGKHVVGKHRHMQRHTCRYRQARWVPALPHLHAAVQTSVAEVGHMSTACSASHDAKFGIAEHMSSEVNVSAATVLLLDQ